MYRKLKLFKGEKGQSLVEFALVLPVLMLILLGIIEFGWLLNAKITLTSAAREGARVLAIEGPNVFVEELNNRNLIEQVVDNSTINLITVGDIIVDPKDLVDFNNNFSPLLSGNIKMAKVEITAVIKPVVGFIIKDNVTMKAEASMRIEYKTTP